MQRTFNATIEAFDDNRVLIEVDAACRKFIKIWNELLFQNWFIFKIGIQRVVILFVQTTLWWCIALVLGLLNWANHFIETRWHSCRKTYAIMVFVFETPKLIRRLHFIIFHYYRLIESNSLIRILHLRIQKFGCWQWGQALFEIDWNFSRILIKSRLVISIIKGISTKSTKLVSS